MLARKYAQALYNKAHEKGARQESVAKDFIELMRARGQLKLLSPVLSEYRKIVETASRRSRVIARVAKEKDVRTYHDEIEKVLKDMGIDEKPERIIDESVVGGVRIESHGAIYDRTYRRGLLELFRQITVE